MANTRSMRAPASDHLGQARLEARLYSLELLWTCDFGESVRVCVCDGADRVCLRGAWLGCNGAR